MDNRPGQDQQDMEDYEMGKYEKVSIIEDLRKEREFLY